MEEKSKKILIAAIIVLVVAVAAYFVLFQKSFESEYAELSNSWKEQDISCKQLHGCDELFDASLEELSSVKESLSGFDSQNTAVKDLSKTYVSLVDAVVLIKEIELNEAELREIFAPCDAVSLADSTALKLEALDEKTQFYVAGLEAFKKNHPNEAELVSVKGTLLPSLQEELELKNLLKAIELLGEGC